MPGANTPPIVFAQEIFVDKCQVTVNMVRTAPGTVLSFGLIWEGKLELGRMRWGWEKLQEKAQRWD